MSETSTETPKETKPAPKAKKPRKPLPATKERTCQGCGEKYTYPEKDSKATRFHCEICSTLSKDTRKIFERQQKKIRGLERDLKKLQDAVEKMGKE